MVVMVVVVVVEMTTIGEMVMIKAQDGVFLQELPNLTKPGKHLFRLGTTTSATVSTPPFSGAVKAWKRSASFIVVVLCRIRRAE